MPHATRAPAPFAPTYRQLLDLLVENAMALTRLVAGELRSAEGAAVVDFNTVARTFAILSTIVRRSIVVSRYIDTLPVPVEEKDGRILPALDRVLLTVFAANKVDIETYNRMIDAELDGELDEELELDFDDDDEEEFECESNPDADVPGRRPAVLVAELCRDFGLVAYLVPRDWMKSVPADLRLLSARAAAAAIRPSSKPVRGGRPSTRSS